MFSTTRLISTLIFFLAFFGLVSSSPASFETGLKKRDNAEILEAFTTLKSSTDEILPQIDDLVASGTATDDTVTPLINQLTDALDTTSTTLSTLEPSELLKRQEDDEIAQLVAEILTDITTTLGSLLDTASTIPGLGGLLLGVDTSLNQVLRGLQILLAGVLRLVANLLTNVATLLRNLAFGLTLTTLGL